jgi:hypothetical protein
MSFPWREHTTKSMRILCNPTKFRQKTKIFRDICGLSEKLLTNRIPYRRSNESGKSTHELGRPKKLNDKILKKIGQRIEKLVETGFDGCE